MDGVRNGWSTGGGPEDFGWVFENDEDAQIVVGDGYRLSAAEIAECDSDSEAYNAGVSRVVLDRYNESDYRKDDYGVGLVDFLQDKVS